MAFHDTPHGSNWLFSLGQEGMDNSGVFYCGSILGCCCCCCVPSARALGGDHLMGAGAPVHLIDFL